jgi:hypothetical protein
VLRFDCSYEGIADSTCSATTIRARRDEWIRLGIFSHLTQIVLETYDRIVGLALSDIAVDGCITKAPGGGECAGPGTTPSANRLQRCYERRENVINAFFDLADAIITLRSLIRRAWTTHRWDNRPTRRH